MRDNICKKNEPLIRIFHGTSQEAAIAITAKGFDLSKSADGSVWFTNNPQVGEVAASGSGAVIEAALDQAALKLGGWDESDRYSTDQLIAMGFDGLVLEDGDETTYQIFKPHLLADVRMRSDEDTGQANQPWEDEASDRSELNKRER